MNYKLKPCPFRGGEAKIMVREKQFLGWRDDGVKVKRYYIYVACKACHSRGEPIATCPSSAYPAIANGRFVGKWVQPYADKAIEKWNRRDGK